MSETRRVTLELEVTGDNYTQVYEEIADAISVIENNKYEDGWAAWEILDVKITRPAPEALVKKFASGGVVTTIPHTFIN